MQEAAAGDRSIECQADEIVAARYHLRDLRSGIRAKARLLDLQRRGVEPYNRRRRVNFNSNVHKSTKSIVVRDDSQIHCVAGGPSAVAQSKLGGLCRRCGQSTAKDTRKENNC